MGQEATVRTRHGKTNWFKIGKVVSQGCILSPCLTSMQDASCAGWTTSWNQDSWEKYQQMISSYGRKWGETKEPCDVGERGEYKN